MAEEIVKPKWDGKAAAKLRGATAEQVWPLLEDFCSFHKWLPSIDTCHQVEGVQGQPGLVRYCASTVPPSHGGNAATTLWCHEKLLAIDAAGRSLTYEVVDNNMGFKQYLSTIKLSDNNMGFKQYLSTIKLSPINGDDKPSCQMEWCFVADPVEGWKFEDLLYYVESSLQAMAEKMVKAIQSTN
ncbi:hypothetical protein RJ639_029091 [Escallonia herrerae]|uniref:Lachrymatory factor synthase n=1 Tax=Escallonia herrerae TaxID=1293975 RepID=A0AA89BR48_9ASTE|nr:hypothetical protein RJ639_029091 [Escallonia herrerae]